MAVSWFINGGDPNHLLTGMILQVDHLPGPPDEHRGESVHSLTFLEGQVEMGKPEASKICVYISIWAVIKTLTTFHYTGWLIRILIMVYYNPHIIG